MRGAPSDMEIQLREWLAMAQRMAEILAHHTAQPLERVQKDMDRDFFMGPSEAKDYGIVDQVISAKRGIAAAAAG
jgi:ATP-dependent Clp protease protease subunit